MSSIKRLLDSIRSKGEEEPSDTWIHLDDVLGRYAEHDTFPCGKKREGRKSATPAEMETLNRLLCCPDCHFRFETQEKRYKACNICGQTFGTIAEAQRHQRRHVLVLTSYPGEPLTFSVKVGPPALRDADSSCFMLALAEQELATYFPGKEFKVSPYGFEFKGKVTARDGAPDEVAGTLAPCSFIVYEIAGPFPACSEGEKQPCVAAE